MIKKKLPLVPAVGILGILLVLAAALAIRFLPLRVRNPRVSSAAVPDQTVATTTADANDISPGFTSVRFAGGDALKGLGPNWTFIRQQDQRSMSRSFIDGTAPTRESVVRLISDPNVSLIIEESNIADRKMLDKALAAKDVKQSKIAGRDGFLVPMGDLAGGQALVLTGTSTVLILQDANAALWPAKPNPEVLMYVGTVNVP